MLFLKGTGNNLLGYWYMDFHYRITLFIPCPSRLRYRIGYPVTCLREIYRYNYTFLLLGDSINLFGYHYEGKNN
jgi:hypothetical protein